MRISIISVLAFKKQILVKQQWKKHRFACICCWPTVGVKHTLSASVFDPGVSEVLILQEVKGQVETDD